MKKKRRSVTSRLALRARARAREKKKFLERLAVTGIVTEACDAAGISRPTAYAWRESDEQFLNAWDEAEVRGTDVLEEEIRRRGVEGWLEPVYQGGKKVGQVRKYSDRLLELLVKARRPKFRDGGLSPQVAFNGPTVLVSHAPRVADDATLLEALEHLREHGILPPALGSGNGSASNGAAVVRSAQALAEATRVPPPPSP